MENLDDQVAQTKACLLVDSRRQQSFGHVNNLIDFADFQDLLMPVKDKIFKGCGSVKQERQVLSLANEV